MANVSNVWDYNEFFISKIKIIAVNVHIILYYNKVFQLLKFSYKHISWYVILYLVVINFLCECQIFQMYEINNEF